MKIEISNHEYQTLLDMLEIASWILFAHRTDDPEDRKHYQDLEQKMFSLAKDFGLGDQIEYAPEQERYFPTREYDESRPCMEYIEEHDEDAFWEELTDRLTARDLIREMGEEAFLALSFEERIEKESMFQNKYLDEFEKHGLKRIEIVE
jgi:hypothetical protein